MSTGSTTGFQGSPGGAHKAWIEALETFNSRMSRAAIDAAASTERQAIVADLRDHLPHLTTAMLGRLAELKCDTAG